MALKTTDSRPIHESSQMKDLISLPIMYKYMYIFVSSCEDIIILFDNMVAERVRFTSISSPSICN